ncbi:hypothetical protein [Geopsychrobacter electrodiphilus]|uniref:hypothetical protein n=1 Tax=Geopsychrobacter electrodiphilus TaxID=225196 RepID=UPI00036AEEDE|nr:hypothetical protein [Geopsychrobacter electrodiphilus]
MGTSSMEPLERAVGRLLQRNEQLQAQCERLLLEQQGWQHQRQALLAEIEEVLADLELLRER